MAATTRQRRARATKRGWRPCDLAVLVAAGAVVLAIGVLVYQRERRLEAKRRFEHEHFIEMHNERMTQGMTEDERREYYRRLDDLERENARRYGDD
jgi:adenylylsulfate kinase-like enzyme